MSAGSADAQTSHAAPRPRLDRWQKAAVALGSGLEFYDFSVLGFFAAPIGRTFFPTADPWSALLLSVGTVGVGYLARPLGAVVLGRYADRRGRKPAMLTSMLVMAAASFGIAVLPGYAALGVASPLLLLAMRLVQGFALGGETGPAIGLLLGTTAPGRRASGVAWQVLVNGAALLAAGIVGLVLSLSLPAAMFDALGWRIAALLGLAVVPVGLVLRSSLPDAEPNARRRDRAVLRPLLARPARLIAATLVVASGTVTFAIGGLMTTYALSMLRHGPAVAFLGAVGLGAATAVTAPLAGWLADHVGARASVIWSRLLLAVFAWPAFVWLADGGGAALLVVSAGLAAASTIGTPGALCLVADAMPPASRVTGLSLSYALGISLFGGATQPAAVALMGWTGDARSPAWLLVGAGVVGAVAALVLRGVDRGHGIRAFPPWRGWGAGATPWMLGVRSMRRPSDCALHSSPRPPPSRGGGE